jgi:hypothetical protein
MANNEEGIRKYEDPEGDRRARREYERRQKQTKRDASRPIPKGVPNSNPTRRG